MKTTEPGLDQLKFSGVVLSLRDFARPVNFFFVRRDLSRRHLCQLYSIRADPLQMAITRTVLMAHR